MNCGTSICARKMSTIAAKTAAHSHMSPGLSGLVGPFVAGRRVRREGKDREAVGAGGRETLALTLAMGAGLFLVGER